MGAGPSSASEAAVSRAMERVVSAHGDYAAELVDMATRRMEADAAACAAAGDGSSARLASARNQALQDSLRERLLADFLKPGSRFHAQLREELQQEAAGGTGAAPSAAATSSSSSPAAVAASSSSSSAPAASSISASAPSSRRSSASSPPASPHLSLSHPSPRSLDRSIRAAAAAHVASVCTQLHVAEQYAAMGNKQQFSDKAAQATRELQKTWETLEF